MSVLATRGCGSRKVMYLHCSQCGKENPKWLWLEQGCLVMVLEGVQVKSLSGTFKPQVTCWFFKTPALREFIDRHCSLSVQRYPSCGRRGAVMTHNRPCIAPGVTQFKTGPWRHEGREAELGEGSCLFLSFVATLKGGMACWKNVFLVGWL